MTIPLEGQYLFEWYVDLSSKLQRIHDGICEPIPPTEFEAWMRLTREIVYPSEYDILSEMDVAYCDEINNELEATRNRERDKIERTAQKGRR